MGQYGVSAAIDKAHRLGPFRNGKTRSIIVKFKDQSSKEFTFSFRMQLRKAQIYVNLHLPEELKYEDTLLNKLHYFAKSKDPYAWETESNSQTVVFHRGCMQV